MMDIIDLLPWRGLKLDPARTQAARRAFDETGRYDAWAAHCRAQMARPVPEPSDALHRAGFEIVRLLSEADAAALKAELVAHTDKNRPPRRDIDYAEVAQLDDVGFLTPWLERMLGGAIDTRIVGHFGSEYFIHSLAFTRTVPARVSRRSFLWHCDRGPRDFLKINLFFDATAEHGATTECFTRESSAAIERIGYTFGPNRWRTADAALLARRADRTALPEHPDMCAGEALLFEPSNVLHRGILPTRGTRHMLSLILLPSPVPWRDAWARAVWTRSAEESAGRFPDDAWRLEVATPQQDGTV
jgi:hypothetical protein